MPSNINILYFSISNQQPRTEPVDALIQTNITSLQEECIIFHVWQLWVHGFAFHCCFHWSTFHWSVRLTLLKPCRTERPKTQSICKRQDHSTVKLDLALGYIEMIWVWVHAPRRWWHFQISVSVARITFPSFHLGCFAGFNVKIKKIKILWVFQFVCLHTNADLSFGNITNIQNITHVCACIYFNHNTSMMNRRRKKKHIKACTKCATACHKSTQHKLDQLLSSCHDHTAHSVDSESVHSCCCFLYCYSNVPPQSCVLQICQTGRKAQLASSVLSGIPSTCSDYSEDVDTDASVFSLSLQAGGITPPYYKNKA